MEFLLGRETDHVIKYVTYLNPEIQNIYTVLYDKEENMWDYGLGEVREVRTRAEEVLVRYGWPPSRKKDSHTYFDFVGIESVVETSSGLKHIPMLDFDTANVPRLRNLLAKLQMPKGVILNSGSGLHYIGVNLMSQAEFYDFPNQVEALKTAEGQPYKKGYPGLDKLWVDISLRENAWRLRMSTGPGKPVQPIVVDLYEIDD